MSEWVDAAALAFRFVLAFVFLNAALPKLLAPREFERAVANYAILPSVLVGPVGRWLPRLELVCAGALFVGVVPAPFSFVAGVLLVLFTAAVAINLLRGRLIDCGCYGATTRTRLTWSLAARDAALAAIAFLVALRIPDQLSLAAWPERSASTLTTADALAMLVLAGSAVIAASIATEGLRARRAGRMFNAYLTAGP